MGIDIYIIWVYTYIIKGTEGKEMTITVKNKKEFKEKVLELRNKGYNIVTFWDTFAEMEKGDKFVTITK